jgi:hypothetical protein
MTDDTRTDDLRTSTVQESAPNATMDELTHANPYTGRTFGDEMVFDRGPAVAADGGHPDAGESTDESDDTMDDVDHEHPHDEATDANRVFARGRDSGDDSTDGV